MMFNYIIEIIIHVFQENWQIHGVKIRVIISLIKDELKSVGFKYVFGRKFLFMIILTLT